MPSMQVPVSKSGGFVEIEYDKIPAEVWTAVIAEGLKAYVNGGMTKIQTKGLEGEELSKAKAAAQAKAEENAKALLDGTIKLKGRKAKSKESGEVMTEARRLAKQTLKDAAKTAGIKVSHVPAKEWTVAVKEYLAGPRGASVIAKARENIEARQAAPAEEISLASLLPDFDKLVARGKESTAKAIERGKQLSAKQAGMTQKRKPKGAQLNA